MIDFSHFKYRINGPTEGLVVNIPPVAGLVVNLQGEFPDHWDRCMLEAVWVSSTSTAARVILSDGGGATATCDLPPNKPFRFVSGGKQYLTVTFVGGAGGDRVRISVVSDVTRPVDNWGFNAIFGYRPSIYLHADLMPGAIGTAPVPSEVGVKHNATQTIPPVLANSWGSGNLRALDFTGNKALRIDALCPLLPNVSGPFTAIMAVNIPNTAAVRGLFDFQDSTLPASRYFDCYLLGTDQMSLYCQGAAGASSANSPALGAGLLDVPLIVGITKHATTWDVCALTAAGSTDVVAGAALAIAGAATFDICTIGAEFDGTTYASFANFQLRALTMNFGTDTPIAQLRAALPRFAVELNCPLT